MFFKAKVYVIIKI